MKNTKPGRDLLVSVKKDVMGIGTDITEVAIDALLEDGLLKDIPIISTIKAFYSSGARLRDYFYVKKILAFLSELQNISAKQRSEFVDQYLSSEETANKFGERILLLIERSDSVDKSVIYGKIFRYHILGNCTYDETLRLCYMVDKAYLPDLVVLVEYTRNKQETKIMPENMDSFSAIELQKAGLLSFDSIDAGDFGAVHSGGIAFYVNVFGKHLVSILSQSERKT